MDFPHGETVAVLTAGEVTDPYSGGTVESWADGDVAATPVDGCGVAGGGSLEPLQDARNAVVSDFDVIMPPGTVVTSANRVIVRGLTCTVEGRPFDWRSPFTGWAPGVIVHAKIMEG